jgi:hypothetical protein
MKRSRQIHAVIMNFDRPRSGQLVAQENDSARGSRTSNVASPARRVAVVDAAAVLLHDPLADREPQAVPPIRERGPITAKVSAEQPGDVGGRDPAP